MIRNKLGEFQPARLTQARKAKKWYMADLAERVNVRRQAISAYENGDSNPSPDVLRALSKQLEVTESFFMTPLRESEKKIQSVMNFRSLKTKKTVKAHHQSTAYMEWFVSLYDFVSEYVEIPKVMFPNYGGDDFLKLGDEDIEDIAQSARRYFELGDGPITNLTMLLENKGTFIGYIPLEPGMDGFSAWYNGRPFILINSNAYHCRARFDLAHELFHLIAHKAVTQEEFEDKDILNTIEKQANRFAGAFLAPYKTFLKEVYSIDKTSLIDLKERWGLSAQAIMVRLCDLQVISEYQKTRFFTRVNIEGWRRKEPLDGITEPERPITLKKVAEFLNENQVLFAEEFISRSVMPKWFVQNLVQLPEAKGVSIPDNVIPFGAKNN